MFRDSTTTATNINETGSFLHFGKIGANTGLVLKGGSTSGVYDTTHSPYIFIDQTNRRIGFFGITAPAAPFNYKSRNNTGGEIILETPTSGSTVGIRVQDSALTVHAGEVTQTKFVTRKSDSNCLFTIAGGVTTESEKKCVTRWATGDVVIGGTAAYG